MRLATVLAEAQHPNRLVHPLWFYQAKNGQWMTTGVPKVPECHQRRNGTRLYSAEDLKRAFGK